MENLTIRRLVESDAQEVAIIIQRNFMEINIKDYPKNDMEKLAKIYDREKVLEINSFAHSYVVCLNEVVIGCGSIASYWGKSDESILLTIFVLPEYHRNGYGRLIMNTLEEDEIFKRSTRIEIPSSITACAFYRKMGYDFKNSINQIDEEGHFKLEKFRV